jgi:hypothetical protein
MSLPYTRKRSLSPAKRPRKRPIVARRVPPDIYVRVHDESSWKSGNYAKAHIRIRRGCYRFLVWRDGGKIREFYLGRVRQASPTPAAELGHLVAIAGEASSSSSRRAQKLSGTDAAAKREVAEKSMKSIRARRGGLAHARRSRIDVDRKS